MLNLHVCIFENIRAPEDRVYNGTRQPTSVISNARSPAYAKKCMQVLAMNVQTHI